MKILKWLTALTLTASMACGTIPTQPPPEPTPPPPVEDPAPVPVPPTPVPPPVVRLPAIDVQGKFFRLETGEHWTSIGASDFNLYARYLAGEDIEPVLAQREAFGFNTLRVWLVYDVVGIGRLIPAEHADFYERLPAFLQALAQHHLYAELTIFTGTQRLLPTFVQQQAHVDGVEAAVIQFNGGPGSFAYELIEVGNEFEQGDNRWFLNLRWPPSLLISGGSVGSERFPSEFGLPRLRYFEFHTNGAFEWWRKVGHNAMEVADAGGLPALANENTRFPDNDSSVKHAFDAAAGGALLAAGSTFHSVHGKTSQLWEGLEAQAAKAWADGAKSVNLKCQDGPYVHRIDLEGPNDLRVYERPVAGVNCIVYIGK